MALTLAQELDILLVKYKSQNKSGDVPIPYRVISAWIDTLPDPEIPFDGVFEGEVTIVRNSNVPELNRYKEGIDGSLTPTNIFDVPDVASGTINTFEMYLDTYPQLIVQLTVTFTSNVPVVGSLMTINVDGTDIVMTCNTGAGIGLISTYGNNTDDYTAIAAAIEDIPTPLKIIDIDIPLPLPTTPFDYSGVLTIGKVSFTTYYGFGNAFGEAYGELVPREFEYSECTDFFNNNDAISFTTNSAMRQFDLEVTLEGYGSSVLLVFSSGSWRNTIPAFGDYMIANLGAVLTLDIVSVPVTRITVFSYTLSAVPHTTIPFDITIANDAVAVMNWNDTDEESSEVAHTGDTLQHSYLATATPLVNVNLQADDNLQELDYSATLMTDVEVIAVLDSLNPVSWNPSIKFQNSTIVQIAVDGYSNTKGWTIILI
jgi:hypothetical protein